MLQFMQTWDMGNIQVLELLMIKKQDFIFIRKR